MGIAIGRSNLGWVGVQATGGAVDRVVLPCRRRSDVEKVLAATAEHSESARGFAHEILELLMMYLNDGTPVPEGVRVRSPWRKGSFSARAFNVVRAISFGEVSTYAEIADKAGNARAARAVGNVMRQNPTPIIVPCHRVVAAGGRLGGFSAPGGAELKARLLEIEGWKVDRKRWRIIRG